MKPKDGFVVKGPYKGFLMHVSSSSSSSKVSMTMVNPLRIGRCDQKEKEKEEEAISGSEIGADNSPGVVAASASAAGSF